MVQHVKRPVSARDVADLDSFYRSLVRGRLWGIDGSPHEEPAGNARDAGLWTEETIDVVPVPTPAVRPMVVAAPAGTEPVPSQARAAPSPTEVQSGRPRDFERFEISDH